LLAIQKVRLPDKLPEELKRNDTLKVDKKIADFIAIGQMYGCTTTGSGRPFTPKSWADDEAKISCKQ